MNLLINGNNREKNCFTILNDRKGDTDQLISLANKNIRFCLGCNACANKLDSLCVLNDFITNEVYKKMLEADKIVLASPLYMSNITGLLKTLIDRFNPFYNNNLFKGKEIYLILTGQGSLEDNEEEIKGITNWMTGISEWMDFKFDFLGYFTSGNLFSVDNVIVANSDYQERILTLKEKIK